MLYTVYDTQAQADAAHAAYVDQLKAERGVKELRWPRPMPTAQGKWVIGRLDQGQDFDKSWQQSVK